MVLLTTPLSVSSCGCRWAEEPEQLTGYRDFIFSSPLISLRACFTLSANCCRLCRLVTHQKSHAKFSSLIKISRCNVMCLFFTQPQNKFGCTIFRHITMRSGYAGTTTNLWIVLNTSQKTYIIKPPKKILAKFSYPKISWNRKFQTPKFLQSPPSLEIHGTP